MINTTTNSNFKRFFVISGSAQLEVCAKTEKEAIEIAQLYFNDHLEISTREVTTHIYKEVN